MESILNGLNPAQLKAVTTPPGATLVLAGPGSGKTRVLTLRIVHLIAELRVAPYRIMAVTFTNKASKEMRKRVEDQIGELRGLTVGTFHSICVRILRREADRLEVSRDFAIFDSSDQLALVKQAMEQARVDEKRIKPKRLQGAISNAKNELLTPQRMETDTYFNEVVSRVYANYQKLLRDNNAMDFDDLLMQTTQLFVKNPDLLEKYQGYYEHILVDEFQDTNVAQYTLLQQLAGNNRNLFVVGDIDQSVYRWRGADYRNVKRFQGDYPECVTILLEQNYRSTQLILDAATAVIDKNPNRIKKKLFTERAGGDKIQVHEAYDENEQAQYVIDKIAELTLYSSYSPGHCAIMYRTNAQSRALEDAFVRNNLPYRLVGATRFYGRREVKDVLAYLRVLHNPHDTVSLFRIINVPARGIGKKAIEGLQLCASDTGLSPLAVLLDLGQNGKDSIYYAMIGARAAKPLMDFGMMYQQWRAALPTHSIVQILDLILDTSGYNTFVNDGTDEGSERWANVMELRNVAAEFSETDLTTFLEEISLVSETDNLDEEEQNKAPTLLTLHAAKGLEFPIVFLIGLADGVFPHKRSFEDAEEMAEERRLMYVGITRAEDQLFMLYNFRHFGYGEATFNQPSRFLSDVPKSLMSGHIPETKNGVATSARESYKRVTTWETPNRVQTGRGKSYQFGSTKKSAPRKVAEENLEFKTGQKVKHGEFGAGIVIESKSIGGDELVTVAFEAVGLKRLMPKIAKLDVIEE